MPTSSIPLDTFPLVFRHLSYSRMYAVMLTCRSLHDLGQSYLVTGFDHLVTSDPSDFSERHSQEINRWLRFIISNLHFRAPMTRHISIHTRGKSKDLLYELLPRVLPYAAQLQQLDLPLDFTTPKAGLFDAIGTLSKLQSLSIFLHWEDDMPLFSTMIKTGTLHLHTVNIHSRYLHMILQVLEPIADTLHSLDVQCNELGEAAKSSGLYTFDQVVHFGLDITMKPVLDQWLLRGTFPNLCSLKLGRFDDQTMHPIPSGLQNKLKDQIKDNPQGWRRLRTVSGAIKWISLWQLDHGESNLKHLIVSGMDHEMKSLIRVLRFFEPRVLDLTFTDQPVPCYDDDGPSIHYFEAISVAHHISQPTDQQYHSEALADRRFMWIVSVPCFRSGDVH
jgi:hypothetical protein